MAQNVWKKSLEGLALIFDLIKLFQKSQNNNSILIEKSKKKSRKKRLSVSIVISQCLVFRLSNGLDTGLS